MAVYAPSPKLLKKDKSLTKDDRFLLIEKGTVLHYKNGVVVQSDLYWNKFPDSHTTLINEEIPESLIISKCEMDHVTRNKIPITIPLVVG